MGASAGRSVGILEPVALALGLDDPTAMREPVERPFGEAFGAQYLGPAIWKGRFVVTIKLVRSYAVEMTSKQLGTDLGEDGARSPVPPVRTNVEVTP